MIPPSVHIAAILLILLLAYSTHKYYAYRRRIPPGPPGIPFLGNVHQAPSEFPWRELAEWHKAYGPVYSLQYGPQLFIMLGSHAAAEALLVKRGLIYSSRPPLPMVNDCVSKNRRIIFLPSGEKWNIHHRLMGNFLTVKMAETYKDLQSLESLQLQAELLNGGDFIKCCNRISTSLGFALSYGERMPKGDEDEARHARKIIDVLNDIFIRRWIVDALPVLNKLPAFLAPWKRYAADVIDDEEAFFTKMRLRAEAKETWNWTQQVKSMKDSAKLSDTERSFVVSAAYEAGADTTTIALQVFALAALTYPDKMAKAQAEIDRVVGRERQPGFEDMEHLPYMDALIKEIHRWRPVIPAGVPHAVTKDDEYNGWHIPKGAAIQANHWAISMNEETYPYPESFRPERWIENPNLPAAPQFGFGRRMCMGRHTVHNTMFITYTRILWAFNIKHAYEEINGQKVRCEVDPMAFTNTFNSSPLPFKVCFEPRDEAVKGVVETDWEGAEKDAGEVMRKVRARQT